MKVSAFCTEHFYFDKNLNKEGTVMKRTKRLLLAVLCIALVLAGALTVVAACQEQETGFSLTLSFDSAKGSVTATKPRRASFLTAEKK